MPPADADPVLRLLRALRWRMRADAWLRWLARVALVLALGLLIVGALNRWWAGRMPWDARAAAWAGAAALAVFVAGAFALSRRPLRQVAHEMDRRGGTRDRFATALDFSRSSDSSPTPMQALAVRECQAFASRGDFRPLAPVRWPREAAWIVVPAIALALLQWDAQLARARQQALAAAAQEEVSGTAAALETLAREAAKVNEQTRAEELRRIAEGLQRSAEQLRNRVTDPAEAEKAALRELSALEQLVKQMQDAARAAVTPEELQALAKALQQDPATKNAAEALEKGQLDEAARRLEEAAKQLAEKADEPSAGQVEKTLREALEQLAQQRQVSQAMRELAKMMAQENSAASEALRQLAQMLRQMPRQAGSQSPSGGKATQQTLQSLLAALQALKHGRGAAQQGGHPDQPGAGGSKVMVESFAPPGGDETPLPAFATAPTGRPGGERDIGTTDSPFGKDQSEQAEKGGELALRGQLGEGETLSQFLPGGAENAKAQRRYKELYEAMAPAAEEAVEQENIPLGSRFFIKRYFEAIRPEE